VHPDVVVECTGVIGLLQQAVEIAAPGGIVCLTGVGPTEAPSVPAIARLATDAVLKNLVVFGSVNANRRHYYRAAGVLAAADRAWLEQLVTRRVDPDHLEDALRREAPDIKVIIEFALARSDGKDEAVGHRRRPGRNGRGASGPRTGRRCHFAGIKERRWHQPPFRPGAGVHSGPCRATCARCSIMAAIRATRRAA
jgi:hypothetical protein